MVGLELVGDLVLAVLAAFIGGFVAQWLRQPVILGYLLAGVFIGPFTPGPTADIHSVTLLAEIGVAFLMFAVGAEFSLRELHVIGRVAILGGILQIGLTMALGAAVGPLVGLDAPQSVMLGALLALSSTVVALKVLQSRGEASSPHGRLALGLAIMQDIAVVPMVVLLPALAGAEPASLQDVVLTIAKAGFLVIAVLLLGTRLAPSLLRRAALTRTRELFLLGVVSLALGTSAAAHLAGLSLAFGAFLAGLVVAESEYAAQVVAEVLPLRDLFSSLFFVSIGMLINPPTLLASLAALLPLVAVAMLGKAAIITIVGTALGAPGRVALPAGLALSQVGEFSFVLAQVGMERGAVSARLFELVLGTALVTIVLTPWLLRATPWLARRLAALPRIGRSFAEPLEGPGEEGAHLAGHAVICGYGRVGRELADSLLSRGIHVEVIEYNPSLVSVVRRAGMPAIYGDAANPAVLEHARLDRARLLAITIPDMSVAERIVRFARSQNRRLDIIARGQSRADLERLRGAGASDVVQPEFEGGIEFIRHAMRRYGILGTELQALTAGRRRAYYQRADVGLE